MFHVTTTTLFRLVCKRCGKHGPPGFSREYDVSEARKDHWRVKETACETQVVSAYCGHCHIYVTEGE